MSTKTASLGLAAGIAALLLTACVTRNAATPPAPCPGALAGQYPEFIDDRAIQEQLGETARKLKETAPALKDLAAAAPARLASCPDLLPQVRITPLESERIYAHCREGVLVFAWVGECPKCHKWHPHSLSSGFVVSQAGLAATCAHVLENARDDSVFVAMDGAGHIAPVIAVPALNKERDIAIVRLGGDQFAPLPIREDAAAGAPIRVISHPDNRFFVNTGGIISRYFIQRGKDNTRPAMAITAEFARGSSGAPVLDMRGNVVGMACATNSVNIAAEKEADRYQQMVMRICVPAVSLLETLGLKPPAPPAEVQKEDTHAPDAA